MPDKARKRIRLKRERLDKILKYDNDIEKIKKDEENLRAWQMREPTEEELILPRLSIGDIPTNSRPRHIRHGERCKNPSLPC